MTAVKIDLLPCPFCGSPAEHYPDGDMEGYDVVCASRSSDCKSNVFGSLTAVEAETLWNRRAAPAPVNIADLLVPQPLTEPVCIAKALLAHREACVVLDAGTGPRAAVHLVNIGLTGWVHTIDTATAFADGYNLALQQLRAALAIASTTTKGGAAT